MSEPYVNPHRITVALDRAKLVGPTADAKLGAREPDLDEWEAGRRRPTEEQLELLGRYAGVMREFFGLADGEYPRITVALVRLRRSCVLMVSMLDELPNSLRRQQDLLEEKP